MDRNADRGRWRGVLLLGVVALGLACQGGGKAEPFVLLLGIDGVSPGLVDELRAEGKLPAIDQLIRTGTWGLLQSVQSLQVADAHPQKGYFSPVIWTSIATGKSPEKHGVLDFALPRPGTSFVWAGGWGEPPRAELTLGEIPGPGPLELRLRLRSYEPNGAQAVEVLFNGQSLGAAEVDVPWQPVVMALPRACLRPVHNRLELRFARQSTPAGAGVSEDRRKLAVALGPLEVASPEGEVLLRFDPIYDRFALGRGFHVPEAEMIDAQSAHWKARPVWSLLGEQGHPVGILGWWATWPATEVHGWLVSSHMGLRGKTRSRPLPHLTWPEGLAEELRPLAPTEAELASLAAEIYPQDCMPGRPDKVETFRQVLWQDELFYRIARRQLPRQQRGFMAVYFESTDVGGHNFLPLRDGSPLPEGCSEAARGIIERVYTKVDRWAGELLGLLPADAVVILVSDHGMVSLNGKGEHYPYGILAAAGPGLRRGAVVQGASVLDVAPTLLHLFGAPIPLDMDGKLLVQLFEEPWLAAHPPRYRAGDGPVAAQAAPSDEASEEVMERLKGIGYIE